jgi:hypothetical protein
VAILNSNVLFDYFVVRIFLRALKKALRLSFDADLCVYLRKNGLFLKYKVQYLYMVIYVNARRCRRSIE